MRVVAGLARGRPLITPKGTDVRPTTDRVREAVFNALHSLGVIDSATVLDLFAGSGALGIEALSRGAGHAVFVERDAGARRAISTNLERTGLAPHADIVAGTAESFVSGGPVAPFDLALLDPPYAYDGWDDLLGRVQAGVVVVETDRELDLGPRWRVVRTKWYGSTLVVIAEARDVPDGVADTSPAPAAPVPP